MRSALTVTGLLLAALLLASCGGDGKDAGQNQTKGRSPQPVSETFDDGLALNDGQKWQLDQSTSTIMAQMAASFPSANLSSLGTVPLQQAGADLRPAIEELLRSCTMDGPDHAQLLVFLNGYIPAVEALAKWGRPVDAAEVRHYLSVYDDYFQ